MTPLVIILISSRMGQFFIATCSPASCLPTAPALATIGVEGTVVEAKVVYDKETGRSRGFGFVVMDTAEEVETSISNLNDTEFEGRLLRVDKVEAKPLPRQDS